jgi:hypothetical protein
MLFPMVIEQSNEATRYIIEISFRSVTAHPIDPTNGIGQENFIGRQ